ncbi:unnamed protein product [Didymodactylos carnosus]|uniref:Peptidase S9 prolyl oligopeptidase catalytic domain-containing protein n=1 Tax=Didymodactylos carnosus TaxID=1234261 RepID=A0A814WMU3_9BILA|nr:unnamed protein product [Didymodactylos carnosus]CAF1204363.1 unnamed protein product [Didymodactylos carnosus]CAF3968676.1 unnamed protein product [Didymodactylos carnosus]CAF3985397.1 unnamed protein product [Didymodactylos carnosus]
MLVKQLLLFIILHIFFSNGQQPKLTLDEFFEYVEFTTLALSSDGQSVLISLQRPNWNASMYRTELYLYENNGHTKKLLAEFSPGLINPQWSPSNRWISFPCGKNSTNETKITSGDDNKQSQYICLYSTISQEIFSISLGEELILAFTWAADNNDDSFYYVTQTPKTDDEEKLYKNEWKDVIQYRESERGDTIYRASNIENGTITKEIVTTIASFGVLELIASPNGEQLALASRSKSGRSEKYDDLEIYTINLLNSSPVPYRLTNNTGLEVLLQYTSDSQHLFFLVYAGVGSVYHENRSYQTRLYSVDTKTGIVQRWAKHFPGSITRYALNPDVIILGQNGTEVHMYTQKSVDDPLIEQNGWNGSYEQIVSSANSSSIAFVHSSFDQPKEVYFIEKMDQLQYAGAITEENKLFKQRQLPKQKVYQWVNYDDGRQIEGILHYPPGKFEQKNLPLFVLIHGGPFAADMNNFQADWYSCSRMIATEDWLVLEPNYRGSTGYGDLFLSEISTNMVSLPGADILYGVDSLVRDGIADGRKLGVGGFSYGGFLTNWLITQTTRFNVGLTGAGALEMVSNWGTSDLQIFFDYLLDGKPWEVPEGYHAESAIYRMNKIRTPTHMITGEIDIRVPTSQSFLMERALYTLNIPHKLLIFPGAGHAFTNPWHGKIKIREELKWLHQYGNKSVLS